MCILQTQLVSITRRQNETNDEICMLLLSLHFYPALWFLCNESIPYGRESGMTLLPMCTSGFFLLSVLTQQQLPKAYGILHHGSWSLCNAPTSSCYRLVRSSVIVVNLDSLFQNCVLLSPCIFSLEPLSLLSVKVSSSLSVLRYLIAFIFLFPI